MTDSECVAGQSAAASSYVHKSKLEENLKKKKNLPGNTTASDTLAHTHTPGCMSTR